jgi:hypothetical protein
MTHDEQFELKRAIPRWFSGKNLAIPLLVGLAIRLFFISHFPTYSDDTKYYEELARNWLDHGTYGSYINGDLTPLDVRVPGYPALLVAVYATIGRTRVAVMVVQAVIDLLTCIFTALLALSLAPTSERRSHVWIASLWGASLCPFTANYTAVVLTEALATCLTTVTLLYFIRIFAHPSYSLFETTRKDRNFFILGLLMVGGVVSGIGAMVRPEFPIILLPAMFFICFYWRKPSNWPKLALATLSLTIGLALPLSAWAARNYRALGRVQFLAPRYAEIHGVFMPLGFYDWTRTWMVRFQDAYTLTWKLNKEDIRIDALPSSAFDSKSEQDEVNKLLDLYNKDLWLSPILDHQFALLAKERTHRHPLRTYFLVPFRRAVAIWFTPRIELLPYSGKVWPPIEKWRSNPTDVGVTVGLGLLNCVYIGLALIGAWYGRHLASVRFLVAFLLIRTALLTQLQTVEPRYVVLCFPVVIALGAQIWGGHGQNRYLPGLKTSPGNA